MLFTVLCMHEINCMKDFKKYGTIEQKRKAMQTAKTIAHIK